MSLRDSRNVWLSCSSSAKRKMGHAGPFNIPLGSGRKGKGEDDP
jgi:hypothetical protein